MKIYSSLSRTKQTLRPQEAGKIRMYVCGMTVYDYCHLGHARMLVSFDVVARWLRHLNYEVNYTRNITDIDDKIIRKAVQQNLPLSEVTGFYTDAMHADERALGVLPPTHEPRATAHISGMLNIIAKLEQKGLAYRTEEGDVNYAVRRFNDYGKLSGRSLDDLRSGERVAVSDSKRDPLDFVLWKAAKPEEPADSKWTSPYGLGRPGWHIECSAMSSELGLPLDIHGGGPDLKFPHHENEIAQTEGALDTPLASIWMHCGPLMVDDEKMSKSLGNFRTIREVVGIHVDPTQSSYEVNPREAEMLRFFIVRNHYRSAQNFTPDNLIDAQTALDRLYQCLLNNGYDEQSVDWSSDYAQRFEQAMNDDFNTAEAMAVLFEMANHANREHSRDLASQMRALAAVLGLLQQDPSVYLRSFTRYSKQTHSVQLSDHDIEALVQERLEAKLAKDFARADAIREQLKQAGVELEDKAGGVTQWRRA